MELWLTVNGTRVNARSQLDPLTRAVVISFFTHRRADPDDNADVFGQRRPLKFTVHHW